MKNKLLFLSLITVLLTSCAEDENMNPIQLEGGATSSVEEGELVCTGSEFAMAFSANASWRIKQCPDWLNVSKTSGKAGTTKIIFSADLNDTRRDRTADIVFDADDGSFSSSFHVVQPCPVLSINRDSIGFEWDACKKFGREADSISILSNVMWKIELLPDDTDSQQNNHFDISSLDGVNDSILHMIPIRDNIDTIPYRLRFRLYAVGEDKHGELYELPQKAVDSYIVNLYQKNLRFLLNKSVEDISIEFSELNDDPNINIEVDSETPWEITECPSWTVIDKKEGSGIVSVNFRADGPAPTKEQRIGTIKLQSEAGAYRTIAVLQRGYVFEVDTTKFDIENDDTEKKIIHLSTTGYWEIRNKPDWLVIEPMEGKGESEIIVNAAGQNLTFQEYRGEFSICSTMNSLSESVEFSQKQFIFEVSSGLELSDLPTMNTGKYPARVISSGNWAFEQIPTWLDISCPKSGKGTFDLTIGPNSGNPDIQSDRSALLKVVSLNHREAGIEEFRTILVKQRKYTFELSEESFGVVPAFKNNFDSYSTQIKCSSDWVISKCPDWLTPDKTSGDGTQDVTITFTPSTNTTKAMRKETIEFQSLYNNENKGITIEQEPFVFTESSISFDVKVMNDSHFTVPFELTPEAGWELINCPEWLHPSEVTGIGSSTIEFTPDPNPNLDERTAMVHLHSIINDENKLISFAQEKYSFDASDVSYHYSELSNNTDELAITCSGPWNLNNVPSWIIPSQLSGSTSGKISIKAEHNVSMTERNATLVIHSALNGLERSIFITQDAFEFNSSPYSFHYGTLEQRTDEIDVVCSGSWEAKNVPAWISISKKEGNGNESGQKETLTISSLQNLEEASRSETIQIVSKDNPAYTKNITINQDKFDFSIDHDDIQYDSPLNTPSNTISVVCPSSWTASSNKEWINLSSTSGEGDGTISITPNQNLTTSDRSAIVTITSVLNKLKRTITVTQPKFIFDTSVNSHAFESPLEADNKPLVVGIKCSAEWQILSDVDWLTISKTSGSGDDNIEISAQTNCTLSRRSGNITIKSQMNGLTKVISISQNAYQFDSTSTELLFQPVPTEKKSIDITCSGDWAASTDASWITLGKVSGKGNDRIQVQVSNNVESESRQALVTISCKEIPSSKKVVKISQEGFVMSLSNSSVEFQAAASNISIPSVVTCSGPWTASTEASWIKLTTTGNTINITPLLNSAKSDRIATIIVKSTLNGWIREINVKQTAYVFDESPENFEKEAVPSTKDVTIPVTCSGSWEAQSDVNWLTVSPNNSAGNGHVTISIKNNPTSSTRNGIVTIFSTDNSSFKKTISFIQKAFVFTISETEKTLDSPMATDAFTATVDCSGTWSAHSNASWLSATKNGNLLVMKASTNTESVPRTATVSVTNDVNSSVLTYSVYQPAYIFDGEDEDISVRELPIPSSFEFKVTCSGSWTTSSNCSWLSATPTTGMGDGNVQISVADNNTLQSRTGQITITSKENSLLKKTITVNQDAFIFSINCSSINFKSIDASPSEIQVSCSCAWEATSDQTWLSVEKLANGVRLIAEPNYKIETRNAVVTFTNAKNGIILKCLVSQSAYKPDSL